MTATFTASTPVHRKPSRLPQLDFLRGIAILMVLMFHIPRLAGLQASYLSVLGIFIYTGWAGVDLFFVLSGFLVSGLLFDEFKKSGIVRPLRFLIRRGFKIYPSFYVFFAVWMISDFLTHNRVAPVRIFSEMLFLQNYFPRRWGHTWTLAVEEHFYLAICLVVYLMARYFKSLKLVPWLCLTSMLTALALRSVNSTQSASFFMQTHFRMDTLAFGVLLSYLGCFHPYLVSLISHHRLFVPAIVLLLLGGLILTPLTNLSISVLGYSMIALGCGGLIISLLSRPWKENRLTNLVCRIGIYSYSIYLWHLPVQALSNALLRQNAAIPLWLVIALYVPISLAVGIIMAKLIECPVLALRESLGEAHGFGASASDDASANQHKQLVKQK